MTSELDQDHKPDLTSRPPEASLAPRAGELLSLPFDQYGRMRIVENVLVTLYSMISERALTPDTTQFTLRVLDVGGYPGILPRFLPGGAYGITVLDVVPDDGSIPDYVQGSGLELPYEAESFDVVTALDTLEHIPQEHRARFLDELKRVARYAVVLVNPVQSVEADLAEETLDEYIRWILDAQQEQLAEHRDYGLPDFEATEQAFTQYGWETLRFPTANVYNWLLMMLAKHYLISMRDEKAITFERTLDRFYNLTFTESDRALPAYRGVLVAVRPGLEAALRRIEEQYPPLPPQEGANQERLQLANILMQMFDLKIANHEDRLLREQMDRRDKHIAGMETRIAVIQGSHDRLGDHNRALHDANRTLHEANQELHEAKRQTEAAMEQMRWQYDAEFARHEDYIARLESEQRVKDEHILYLERLLQGIESGRVMRLTRAVARFLGRH